MGTRHLICVYKNGEYKIAQYGQWDGYPTGQGVEILDFLSSNSCNIVDLEAGLNNIYTVTDQERNQMYDTVPQQLPRPLVGSLSYSSKSEDFKQMYPSLSRDTSTKILDIVANSTSDALVPVKLKLDFAEDSLFCEWCYVIDLDKRTFEVYSGFNEMPIGENERFYTGKTPEPTGLGYVYYPVKLRKSWLLDSLPELQDFIEFFTNDEESE